MKIRKYCVIMLMAVLIISLLYSGTVQQLLAPVQHLAREDLSAEANQHGTLSLSARAVGHLINSSRFRPLSSSVIEQIKTFVFFVGVGRSGHSIVGVLLDNHPHIVISDELNVFNTLLADRKVNKYSLFNQIWFTSHKKAVTADTSSNLHSTSKGYSLAIDGLYQGSYQSYIDVIGDKMGGTTIKMFLANPREFETRLNRLRTMTNNLTVKVFRVIRNPYDNIATMVIYKHVNFNATEVVKIKNSNMVLNASSELVYQRINYYFKFFQASELMRQQFNLDIMDVHGKDLITNPTVIVNKMCDFLRVSCSNNYLNTVGRKIFSSESKTRYKVAWTDEQLSEIRENILKYDTLRRYSDFDS